MTEIKTFEEALAASDQGNRHVLLGNGFSMACKRDVFAYSQLLDKAVFEGLSTNARKCFDVLDTQDFETVMSALRTTTKLVKLYGSDTAATTAMQTDALALREVLVKTISENHPERPADVPTESYAACRQFLDHFEKIYSLNYDLLLYWAWMQNEPPMNKSRNDGFSSSSHADPWVVWDRHGRSYDQNVFYLHGALHIYDAGHEVQKFTWSRTQVPLIDQIRQAMENDKFPIFVAEGESRTKLRKIVHHGYLDRAVRSFSNINGHLFIYGHSLADSDEHILSRIEQGKVKDVWVSIYGDPAQGSNPKVIQRAKRMEGARKTRKGLQVHFFDADTANVWG